MHSDLRRLIPPTILFFLFIGLGLFSQDLVQRIGSEAIAQTQLIALYALEIGIWLSGAYFFDRFVQIVVWRRIIEPTVGRTIPRLLKHVGTVVVFTIAITGIIGVVFHQEITAIWATSGVISLVLGLALKDAINDIFVGLAVNIDQSYRIGDFITIVHPNLRAPLNGRVVDINWRTTHIESHRVVTVIPNSLMGSIPFVNYSIHDERIYLSLLFTLDYTVPTERALRVLLAGVTAAISLPEGPLAEPAPVVRANAVTALGVEYRVDYNTVVAKVSSSRVRHTVIRSVLEHLDRAGLSLAYPKQDNYYFARPLPRGVDYRSDQERADLLAGVELFRATLRPEEIRDLAGRIVVRLCRSGETLIQQGDEGDSMFVVAEGLLYVYVENDESQREVRVGQITPGQPVGEMSLLTGEARTATVTAATEAVVFEIHRDHVAPLFEERPAIAQALSVVMAERRLKTMQALAASSTNGQEADAQGLASQFLAKMGSIFRIFGRVGSGR